MRCPAGRLHAGVGERVELPTRNQLPEERARRPGVAKRRVEHSLRNDVEGPKKPAQLIAVSRKEPPGQPEGVDEVKLGPLLPHPFGLVRHKPDVESHVVSYNDARAEMLEQAWQLRGQALACAAPIPGAFRVERMAGLSGSPTVIDTASGVLADSLQAHESARYRVVPTPHELPPSEWAYTLGRRRPAVVPLGAV